MGNTGTELEVQLEAKVDKQHLQNKEHGLGMELDSH